MDLTTVLTITGPDCDYVAGISMPGDMFLLWNLVGHLSRGWVPPSNGATTVPVTTTLVPVPGLGMSMQRLVLAAPPVT
jgi:hypothetical protein